MKRFYTLICTSCGDLILIGTSGRKIGSICNKCRREIEAAIIEARESAEGALR